MGKKNLIIDLDETLIYSLDRDDYVPHKHDKKKHNFKHKYMDEYYTVFYRPGLEEFLDYIFKNFNVSVFTAASKSYAMFIIENIIMGENKKRHPEYIFFSYHCDITKKLKKGIKDLTILWDQDGFNLPNFNECNTIIIDDNPDVKKTGYCIQVPEFNFLDDDCENDSYLEELKNILEDYKNFPKDQVFIY